MVVVPTYQEAANVPLLFDRMKTALDGLPWEMVVVDDDSPDGTAAIVNTIPEASQSAEKPSPEVAQARRLCLDHRQPPRCRRSPA